MRILAFANQKGGTGKTTTTIHLAAAIARLGKRVLALDLDPQAHATLGLGCAIEEVPSIARVFRSEARLSDVVVAVPGGFHLAPSSLELSEFEETAERMIGPERVLAQALQEVEGRYDWVLVDCPPRADGVLCANAVRAADTAVLVVETGAFALQGAIRARVIFEDMARELGRTLDVRVLATMFEPRIRFSRDLLVAMQARFGADMLDTAIRRNIRLREAAAFGLPVQELDPGCSASADFEALGRELLELERRDPAPVHVVERGATPVQAHSDADRPEVLTPMSARPPVPFELGEPEPFSVPEVHPRVDPTDFA